MGRRFRFLSVFAVLFAFFYINTVFAISYEYSCPDYKKYYECNSGYYLSDCGTSGWTGQSISSPAFGNSCVACPSGYSCSGGVVCPKSSGITCSPGYYLPANSSTCSTCGSSSYYCPGGTFSGTSTSSRGRYTVSSGYYSTGGTSTTRTGQSQCTGATYCTGGVKYNCPSETTAWTRYGGTGWTSYTQCYQETNMAPYEYCTAGRIRVYANSATTWGWGSYLQIYAVQAVEGAYVDIDNPDVGAICSPCSAGTYSIGGVVFSCTPCATGSYNTSSGSSSCTACSYGLTTNGTGQTSCSLECANTYDEDGEVAVKGWLTPEWNSNNTVSNLCVANSCTGGENGHYLNNGSCPLCSSFANGLYPRSANSGTTGGKEACFFYKSDLPGYYILSANDDVATPCPKGTYSPASDVAVHYGETSRCNTCPDNTYSEGAASECTACLKNYTTYGEKTSASACRIMCAGGYYIATPNATECSQVGPGYWSEQNYTSQGSSGLRNACPAGLTTIGFGFGADEAADCGKVLNISGNKLYLRSDKKTDIALNMKIDGTTYYGNMTTDDKNMTFDVDKKLKINVDGLVYSIYDDSVDNSFGGGETSVKLNPNTAASSISPASYNDASGLAWSATIDGVVVEGTGACSATTASNGDISQDGFVPEGSGSGCWCKITSPSNGEKYVFGTTNSSCSTKCGYFCANNMKGTSAKNITYRSNLYMTAGLLDQ